MVGHRPLPKWPHCWLCVQRQRENGIRPFPIWSLPQATACSGKQRDKREENPSWNVGAYRAVLLADEDLPVCMGWVLLPSASSCCPPESAGVGADVPWSVGVLEGERTPLSELTQGWNSHLGLAHASLLKEFAKFTPKTVSNCEMQFFRVAPVVSPETHRRKPPPKQCLCLQQTLPGKRGSQLRCPSLLRALAPSDCHIIIVLVTLLCFKETVTTFWAHIDMECKNILGYPGQS